MKVSTRFELRIETDFLSGFEPSVDFLEREIIAQLKQITVQGESRPLLSDVEVSYIEPVGLLGSARNPTELFFKSLLLNKLDKISEQEATKGFCPKCHTKTLKKISSSGGIDFYQCSKCSDVVMLS